MNNIDDPGDKIFVPNAGLSIVAVYLPQFFDSLKLTIDTAFINNDAAIRATLLTQYIVTGETVFHDHDLVLNKVMCGLEIEKPVPESIEVTSDETAEAASLLHAVISHWQKLGNTSIEGLRETFLIRSGRIFEEDQSWILDVESRSFDILLDYLPWSYNFIKLPWMKKPLTVNWR
ncbi:MAG: contractile injection system tape measure protein [Cyclobacteriaceae bacterium]|nr:contractile injection system tape measure protein [Cyclobacteriaceae bacterium]